eukprot:Gb_01594 [translate_table: standard]
MGDENQTVQRRLSLLASHLIPHNHPFRPREDVLPHLYRDKDQEDYGDKLVILNATKGKVGQVADQAAQKATDAKGTLINSGSSIKKRVEHGVGEGKEYLQSAGEKLARSKDTTVSRAGKAKESSQNLARDTARKVTGETQDEVDDSSKHSEGKNEQESKETKGFFKSLGDKAAESAKIAKESIVGRNENVTQKSGEQSNQAAKDLEKTKEKAQGAADKMRHQDKGLLQSAGKKISQSVTSVKSTIFGQ